MEPRLSVCKGMGKCYLRTRANNPRSKGGIGSNTEIDYDETEEEDREEEDCRFYIRPASLKL